MTPPQTRSNGIIASPQIVIQSPQNTQQQLTASKLSAAANSLLQLQHQQQLLLAAMPVPVTNSVQCQNPVVANGEVESPSPSSVDHFKIYSESLNVLKMKMKFLLNNFSHSTGNPDILICGNCRELFSELNGFLEHRRSYCKLRFTCKCQDQHPIVTNNSKFSS